MENKRKGEKSTFIRQANEMDSLAKKTRKQPKNRFPGNFVKFKKVSGWMA